MRVLRALNQTAAGMGSVYKIVFTGLLLFEIIRYQMKRKRYVEGGGHRPTDNRN